MTSSAVTVVIITFQRPEVVRTNLEHLARQTVAPHQVLVVDSSPDDLTREVVKAFPFATFIKNPAGAGNMTSSRNEALGQVTGDLLSFLDDDAYPAPEFVAELTSFVDAHPEVALGCCRTLNGVPGEDSMGVDSIGRFLPDGSLEGNFGADPGRDLPIDHGIGASMWMRTELITQLQGFREYYTGVSGVREDADLFLRAAENGHQAWFVHKAVTLHVAAPQAKGQRFDLRYRHWASRNHTILLLANFGLASRMFWRAVLTMILQNASQAGSPLKRAGRTAIAGAGIVRGAVWALRTFGPRKRPPIGGFRQGERPLTLPRNS